MLAKVDDPLEVLIRTYNGNSVIVNVCAVVELFLNLGVILLGWPGNSGQFAEPLTIEPLA